MVYRKYSIMVEWGSLNKKHDLRFLQLMDFNDIGELKFHSIFNPEFFIGSIRILRKEHNQRAMVNSVKSSRANSPKSQVEESTYDSDGRQEKEANQIQPPDIPCKG